jgi:hypothetical protein
MSPVRRSSTVKWWSSMMVAPISPSFRPNSPRASRIVSSTTLSIFRRDGDLRKLPQVERKQMLSDLLGENDIGLPVIYSEHLIGDGQEMFEHAAKLNFEGIVSKKAQAPYRSDRNEGC